MRRVPSSKSRPKSFQTETSACQQDNNKLQCLSCVLMMANIKLLFQNISVKSIQIAAGSLNLFQLLTGMWLLQVQSLARMQLARRHYVRQRHAAVALQR